MRLYTTTGATQVDDPEHGTFKADANGAFDGLPDAMYAKLHGRPGWENDPERELRITAEELDRFRDPAELLKAVHKLDANQSVLVAAIAGALGLVPAADPAGEASAPVRDAAPAEPAVASESAPEASNDEGDSSATSIETSAGESESETPTGAATPAKTTAGRGRAGKTAKAVVSEPS